MINKIIDGKKVRIIKCKELLRFLDRMFDHCQNQTDAILEISHIRVQKEYREYYGMIYVIDFVNMEKKRIKVLNRYLLEDGKTLKKNCKLHNIKQ